MGTAGISLRRPSRGGWAPGPLVASIRFDVLHCSTPTPPTSPLGGLSVSRPIYWSLSTRHAPGQLVVVGTYACAIYVLRTEDGAVLARFPPFHPSPALTQSIVIVSVRRPQPPTPPSSATTDTPCCCRRVDTGDAVKARPVVDRCVEHCAQRRVPPRPWQRGPLICVLFPWSSLEGLAESNSPC